MLEDAAWKWITETVLTLRCHVRSKTSGPGVHMAPQAALKQLDLVKADQAKLRLDKDPM